MTEKKKKTGQFLINWISGKFPWNDILGHERNISNIERDVNSFGQLLLVIITRLNVILNKVQWIEFHPIISKYLVWRSVSNIFFVQYFSYTCHFLKILWNIINCMTLNRKTNCSKMCILFFYFCITYEPIVIFSDAYEIEQYIVYCFPLFLA